MLSLTDKTLRHLDAPALTALLRATPVPETVQVLTPVLHELASVSLPLAAAWVDALGADIEEGPARAWLAANTEDSNPATAPALAWVCACVWERLGESGNALSAWQQIVDAGGCGNPGEACLALARQQLRMSTPEQALVTLRHGLQQSTSNYDFWSRAERLYRRLLPRLAGAAGRPLKIALLGSSTTTFLAGAIRVAAVRDGFAPEVYEGPFGAWRQEILNEASGLYAFAPDVVILATDAGEARLPAFMNASAQGHDDDSAAPNLTSAALADATRPILDELSALWDRLLKGLACTVLQFSFEPTPYESGGMLSANALDGRTRRLRALNEQLRTAAPPGVTIVDLEALAASALRWADARGWYLHKQHPTLEALPLMADACQSLIRAATGTARKVLVLDLDNTLWSGVIGEDGLAGIRVGAPHPAGEAHAALQRYARELKERGVLLAVCSKNNEADARLPFVRHDGMVLTLDDFAAFVANWEDKPANLLRIAQELNLGLESFVFVDDNPVERARVRAELPEVAVPEIGTDPAEFPSILASGRWFEALRLSQEDRERHAAYRANAARREFAASAPDLNSFLRGLSMTVACAPFGPENLDRVAQLIGKTNQYNLTTRRHSLEKLRQLASDPSVWTQVFGLCDCYGDNGLVGVAVAVPTADDEWEIDTFLMSCRVIGRELETYMLASLLRAAGEHGIRRVYGRYLPTAKNTQVADFYPRHGFTACDCSDDETQTEMHRRFVFEFGQDEIPAVTEGLFARPAPKA